VWLDFMTIDRLDYPFKLPYTYLMNDDAIAGELLLPEGLGLKLQSLGLVATELTEEEFFLAADYMERFPKPSKFDCIALAIAKVRGIILLTGDKALRKAAKAEGVEFIGTIGIIDQMYESKIIDKAEYVMCLKGLLEHNGGIVRLPEEELVKRIKTEE